MVLLAGSCKLCVSSDPLCPRCYRGTFCSPPVDRSWSLPSAGTFPDHLPILDSTLLFLGFCFASPGGLLATLAVLDWCHRTRGEWYCLVSRMVDTQAGRGTPLRGRQQCHQRLWTSGESRLRSLSAPRAPSGLPVPRLYRLEEMHTPAAVSCLAPCTVARPLPVWRGSSVQIPQPVRYPPQWEAY